MRRVTAALAMLVACGAGPARAARSPQPPKERCGVPAGDMLVAHSVRVIVYSSTQPANGGAPSDTTTVWYGCLRPSGVPYKLAAGSAYDEGATTIGQIALGGGYAAIAFVTADYHYNTCSETITRFDLRRRAQLPLAQPYCVVVASVDSLRIDAAGAVAWRAALNTYNAPAAVNAVSCPATSLCAAGSASGEALISTDPGASDPTWTPTSIAGQSNVSGISCAGVTLCVATDGGAPAASRTYAGGDVISSTDPFGPSTTWKVTTLRGSPLNGVSCPTPSFCLAIGSQRIYSSTDPTGGAAAWHGITIGDKYTSLFGVSCPSEAMCAAIGSDGTVYISGDPGRAHAVWRTTRVDPGPFVLGGDSAAINCPTTTFCIALDSLGNVLSSTQPRAGAAAWHLAHLGIAGLLVSTGVSFPTVSACVLTYSNQILASSDPLGDAGTWRVVQKFPIPFGGSVSCASIILCVAFDGGAAYMSTTPLLAGSWTAVQTGSGCPVQAYALCDTEAVYAFDKRGTRLLDSAGPGAGGQISGLAFTRGGRLTWRHDGQPRSQPLA
ncbi:MAG: hypothetical protein ACYDHH_10490 [Solirubrobacteraceae bacterium]